MTDRSPGVKFLLVGLVAVLLALPLMMVYALVRDREGQSQQAQASITAGWGGQQVISGPVLVIPYVRDETVTEEVNGSAVTRTRQVRAELFLSPATQSVRTTINPRRGPTRSTAR
jgi:inner membrane protein